MRIGKFESGATKEDKATLFRAVANIAGDCAAIIPASMAIEFVEAKNVTAGSELYEKRADWLDRQVSKAVLGQTTTTDAVSGGHAVSQEHRQVQEDIERADCKSLSAVLNRDLIRPWVDLEYGPQKRYPRLIIARPGKEDLKQLSDSLAQLVPLGLKVSQSEVRDKFGLGDPASSDDLLTAPAKAALPANPAPAPEPAVPAKPEPAATALHAEQAAEPAHPVLRQAQEDRSAGHPAEQIATAIAGSAAPAIEHIVISIQSMLDHASGLEEFKAMLSAAYGSIDSTGLAEALAGGIAAAQAAGRADLVEEAGAE